MNLYISSDLTSSFNLAWETVIEQFKYVVDSLFHISIGGVSLGIIWLSLNVILTVIVLTVSVANNGAGNTVSTSLREKPRSISTGYSSERGYVDKHGEYHTSYRNFGKSSVTYRSQRRRK